MRFINIRINKIPLQKRGTESLSRPKSGGISDANNYKISS
ncbi:hypothetical protein ADICYQ_3113 [Cyclobacterium qasimii M12-11B]|uniref:Uncharacterized protein n=1 Tax=Cyclobacterium qasimii M12-11B TaxID=641524 RepID=S7VDG1_9BACT|nr:hypothetical protein ADICYQ_3113 [Cyclobacterium qasimii M12-11B]